MNEKAFTWVSFFEELADCLLRYKNNRKELIELVKQAHKFAGKNLPKIERDNANIPDIDPFTIYALFNRGKQSVESRSKICDGYKKVFGIKSDVPRDYNGIPVYAYNQYCFYRYVNDPKRAENCFDLLWALFESGIAYSRNPSNSQQFCEYFEKSLSLPMVGLAKLTMGLYQMRPTTYVNIDRINVPLIETKIKIPKDITNGRRYLSFCSELKDSLQSSFHCNTFFEFSFLAFQYSTISADTKPTSLENMDSCDKEKNNDVTGMALMSHHLPKNIILYGPPGTGKTYNTVIKAVEIIKGEDLTGQDYGSVKKEYNQLVNEGRIKFVTFHQSYGYEEFVQGIKPVTKEGEISYEVQDGIFKEFCDEKAEKDKNSNYVFIIDEINRGNISKIFGELITLIEDNKREGASEAMKITLPYKKDGEDVEFSVPENVYIIGTMNTADRSIAAIDTALRRRFTFIEMMPDNKVLEGVKVGDIDIPQMLKTMNERIAVLYDREHTIGHAYFMPLMNKEKPKIADLKDIFRNKIIPLLQEYFYEDYGKIRLALGDNQKEKAGLPQFITSEAVPYDTLFGNPDEYELGERSKKYTINEKAFKEQQAYIGIYNVAKEELSKSNGKV